MGVVDLASAGCGKLLAFLLANDVARIPNPGQGQYSLMLNIKGGIADDLIVYRQGEGRFFLVVNAGTREKDVAWIRIHAASYGVAVNDRTDLAMIAVQGPQSLDLLASCLSGSVGERVRSLKPFHFLEEDGWRFARTGYTGESGFELILPADQVGVLWDGLLRSGAAPIGLGARDTLRLEAGLNLYGHDMTEETTPLESGVAWTVAWEPESRDFLGRQALQPLWGNPLSRKRVGLILEGKGVLRDHQAVLLDGQEIGEITSGGYSPTLEAGIALARVSAHIWPGSACEVQVRNRRMPVRAVRPPFVRFGRSAIRD